MRFEIVQNFEVSIELFALRKSTVKISVVTVRPATV